VQLRWAQEQNTGSSLAGREGLLQLSRTPRAAGCKMKSTPSYSGGASSASGRNISFLARQQSNCGAIVSNACRVRPKNHGVQRAGSIQAPQMLLESMLKGV
jgi:hypothetical protein